MSPAGSGGAVPRCDCARDDRRSHRAVARLGGIATRGTLLLVCDRGDLDRAVLAGDIVRIARGRYALAAVDQAQRAAARVGGALALASAALHHGWAVKVVPDRPQVMLSRGRRVRPSERGVDVHRAELSPEHVADGVTTPEVTLAHCLRRLQFDEALGPGSPQMRRVAHCASAEAANPFESVLRAIALDVPGLDVQPQVTIREPDIAARPDLVDVRSRIILEADSFEWHGGRAQPQCGCPPLRLAGRQRLAGAALLV